MFICQCLKYDLLKSHPSSDALSAFITSLWLTRTYQEDTPKAITSLILLLVICHLYCKLFNRVTQWVSLLEQELLTLSASSELTIGLSGVRDTQSLVFCVVLCRYVYLLAFFFKSLYFLSFHLRLLITPLVSSNFSVLLWILSHISR